ncbi:hypothetical protein M5K25_012694 [Dendrobium thyrsiflorum]|uniref:Uncharacterized protein n=1 Tax=Dendrobium thyrsiflorum TaxID=117978 RepID=A0ABD0UXU0_DENTH
MPPKSRSESHIPRRGTCPLTDGFATKWHRRINGYDSGPSEPGDSPLNGITILRLWPAPTNIHPRSIRYPWTKQPMAADKDPSIKIQLANVFIEIGNAGATIQFGSLNFPAVFARTAVVPVSDINTGKPTRRLHSSGAPTRRTHLPARRPAVEEPSRRTSVFERLSQSEVPTIKRTLTGGRILVVAANTTTLPTGSPISGNNNVETSSSGGRLTRR